MSGRFAREQADAFAEQRRDEMVPPMLHRSRNLAQEQKRKMPGDVRQVPVRTRHPRKSRGRRMSKLVQPG